MTSLYIISKQEGHKYKLIKMFCFEFVNSFMFSLQMIPMGTKNFSY